MVTIIAPGVRSAHIDRVTLTDSIVPPEPEGALPILHDREYRVRAVGSFI